MRGEGGDKRGRERGTREQPRRESQEDTKRKTKRPSVGARDYMGTRMTGLCRKEKPEEGKGSSGAEEV